MMSGGQPGRRSLDENKDFNWSSLGNACWYSNLDIHHLARVCSAKASSAVYSCLSACATEGHEYTARRTWPHTRVWGATLKIDL